MEVHAATTNCSDESGVSHSFQYSLLSQLEGQSRFCCEVYGIRITSDRGGDTQIPAITTSRTEINALLAALIRNNVGPAGLADIVADWKKQCAG